MPTSGTPIAPARTTRFIHAAMFAGVVLLGLVTHLLKAKVPATATPLPAVLVNLLPGFSLAVCVAALFLRRSVPRRASDESADLFWSRAMAPALVMWALLEGAGLLDVIVYWQNGSETALALAVVVGTVFVVLNPAMLERR